MNVLPKGKLDDGETPRDAAEREVIEETGHDVAVHDFLGTLVYDSGGRPKVVHYWRMEASGEQAYDLTDDVRAVDWLPLDAAVERLSRAYERAFLAIVGPLALEAAAPNQFARPPKAKPPVLEKRRGRQAVANPPSLTTTMLDAPRPDLTSSAIGQDELPSVTDHIVETETSVGSAEAGLVSQFVEAVSAGAGSEA
jgi:8-oxo-dGTP diphosphatase